MQKHLLFFFFFFFVWQLNAQPEQKHRYGCHFAKNQQAALAAQARGFANNSRSDTFDILNYDIGLDISSYTAAKIKGVCTVRFSPKLPDITSITLDLLGLSVDSVRYQTGAALPFTHQDLSLIVQLPEPVSVGETAELTVWYGGTPIQSTSGFGGVYFEQNYIYNLSIGLTDDPHNFGHAWFPCFDNFRERSTYDLSYITTLPYRAYSVGDFVSEDTLGNAKVKRKYKVSEPLATYHVSFAAANYAPLTRTHTGIADTYPMTLLAKPADTSRTKTAFWPYLGSSVDCFEKWFGPYNWSTIGYALAPRGAMENPGCTIYPDFLIDPLNIETHKNIMSHELAHNWWGNVVTVGSQADMWVKEGNAEYGAHLFVEYFSGKKAFIETLRENTFDVLKSAHYNDGRYLPLSPMPKDITYGTTTYNKGALVMHNMRAYLGDTLFRQGMTHIQAAMKYRNMDAYQFRDTMSAFTGYDLTDFFADQVFSPGFTDFEIDKMDLTPAANGYSAEVTVRQKVRACPNLHQNVPVEVNFRAANGTVVSHKMMVSGETGTATFDLDFQPVMTYLNGNQLMNLAQIAFEKVSKANGNNIATNTGVSLTMKGVTQTDSAFVRVVHHWTSPDLTGNLPPTMKISKNHYWTFDGTWGQNFTTTGLFRFNNSVENAELDADLLTGNREDSLFLLWRPTAEQDWVKCPRTTLLSLGSATDGNGYIRADTLQRGQYALAYGFMDAWVGTEAPYTLAELTTSPNPVVDDFRVMGNHLYEQNYNLELYSTLGNRIVNKTVQTENNGFSSTLAMDGLPSGTYLLLLKKLDGTQVGLKKVQKI